MAGTVYFVAPGVEAFRVKKGMVFQKGYTIATQSGGRALIARGTETISVGPNSKFAISAHRSQGINTTILQRKGTIEVDVNKRARPHFTVETPFMAAVVKGTKFEVVVGAKKASLRVERGLVQVNDFASGDRADVGAGQAVSSAPSTNPGLQVSGKTKPVVQAGRKRAPVFQTPAVKNVPTVASVQAERASSGLFGGLGNGSNNAGGNGPSANRDPAATTNGESTNHDNGNGAQFGRSDNAKSNGQNNGNSGSNGNSGNNGNGNSGNNGNGNSGSNGNGNGNSGNNGNGNSGENGNSGNNGNGNSGGNGNGNGKSGDDDDD